MDTTPTEYSKSGSDSEAAEDPSAFDPSNTSPEASESSSEATKGVRFSPSLLLVSCLFSALLPARRASRSRRFVDHEGVDCLQSRHFS